MEIEQEDMEREREEELDEAMEGLSISAVPYQISGNRITRYGRNYRKSLQSGRFMVVLNNPSSGLFESMKGRLGFNTQHISIRGSLKTPDNKDDKRTHQLTVLYLKNISSLSLNSKLWSISREGFNATEVEYVYQTTRNKGSDEWFPDLNFDDKELYQKIWTTQEGVKTTRTVIDIDINVNNCYSDIENRVLAKDDFRLRSGVLLLCIQTPPATALHLGYKHVMSI